MSDPNANKALIEELWAALARRDFAAVAACFSEDGHYTDVPAPEDGARGPAAIEARLRLGLEPLERYVLNGGPMVAEGDMVITEHSEDWYWPTGEHVRLPFVSVHEVHDGRVTRWWDYWDLGTLMNAAPAWWVEQIMVGYQ
ncbi:MAG: nuclear transport factor 2 family protein [Actinobacteria bacterium]|nr:nuclear transport factor 2 family protein [Actinomycetota bacterium]